MENIVVKRSAVWALLLSCVVNFACANPMDQIDPHTENAVLGSKENPIRVGVLTLEPFAENKSGSFHGLVIDYWDKIAKPNGWHYVYSDAGKNYSKAIEATHSGQYYL